MVSKETSFEVEFGGQEAAVLLARLAAAGVELNEYARRLFASPLLIATPTRQTAQVALVTIGDLGFAGGANLVEIGPRLAHLGYYDFPELAGCIASMEIVLNELGYACELGAGVRAAQQVYQCSSVVP